MVEIDREQFAKIITAAWKVYSKKLDSEILNVFWGVLEGYSLQVVSKAISVHLKTSAYAPKPSDILKIINPKGSYANTHQRKHACEFEANGNRCPLNGTLSPNTNGGGPWYCLHHFFHKGLEGAQILDDLLENHIVEGIQHAS